MMKPFAKLVLLLMISCTVSYAGSISGTINFTGNKPAPKKIQSDAKCLKLHNGKLFYSDQLVVNPNNTVKWVFIYVKKGLEGMKFPQPKNKAVLNQEGCFYSPHVLGMMVNQPLDIINSDPMLHNVNALAKNNPQFNIGQAIKGKKDTKTFVRPEVMIRVKCDVHSWMNAWIGVLEHPFFAVSDDKGKFTINNLPAGTYELEAWHETLGAQTMKVTVGATDTQTADFTFRRK